MAFTGLDISLSQCRKETATIELRFEYDGWNLIGTLNSELSTLNSFARGLDLSGSFQGAGGIGGLLWVNNGSASTHFVSYDGNGNVTALVNAADGSESARYEYGPFGEVIRASGPAVGSMVSVNPFRFSTKYQDDETDLLYYGYRYYSASTGRWLSRDPIGEKGGLNLYGFLNSDPIGNSDVLGRSLLSLQLFVEWLIGGNGYSPNPNQNNRFLEWSNFDSDGAEEASLTQRWILQNRPNFRPLCRLLKPGQTRSFDFSGSPAESSSFNSGEPWISEYQTKAGVTPVHRKIVVTMDSSCCCDYQLTLQLWATDTADFNPGDSFGPWGIIKDDWFVWISNHTPLGFDYREGAVKDSLVSFRDCPK